MGLIAVCVLGVTMILALSACYGTKHVAFAVCTRNDTWVRPTGVWNPPQYQGFGGWRETYTGNFFRYFGSASLSSPWMSRAGLTEFWQSDTGECGTTQERHARLRKAIEVWTVLYDVTDVTQVGQGFRIHVAPIDKGFRAIQFDRGDADGRRVEIIGRDGGVLECFGSSEHGGKCK